LHLKLQPFCCFIRRFPFVLHDSVRAGADVAAAAVHLALQKVDTSKYNHKPLMLQQGCNLMFTATSLIMPLPVSDAE
jgi:hypothetical protein